MFTFEYKEYYKDQDISRVNKIAGISLDENQFSELSSLEKRFWDPYSDGDVNANVNGGSKISKASITNRMCALLKII